VVVAASRQKKRPRAASSSPTPPRKSRRKAKSSPSAPAPATSRQAHPLDVKAGDRVLFGKWSGTEVKLDGEDLLIMKESDIMGIIG
jgi:chaperonin GroES